MSGEDTVRVIRVIRFIEENLSNKLDLDTLASMANLSKYHFSRVFTGVVGVTPIVYVTRKRLQKSVYYLLESSHSILEIAYLCGFDSASSYNAVFKKHFDQTPSQVRKNNKQIRNFSLDYSKMQGVFSNSPRYDERDNNRFLRRIWEMNITIKELPSYEVAFVRHVGSYLDTWEAWDKLGQWAAHHELHPTSCFFIGISLDDPSNVEEYACRYDACVTVPEGFRKDQHPDIQYKQLSGGLYALHSFYDTIDKLAIAYQSLYVQWLPGSEYEADNRHCLEFCMNNPKQDPEGKAKVDLYVPVRRRD
ncbi:AraC family transcriptional regulator [Cohnella silvisoli]|uniref:AraC family transcriptional regulator n=1 Tax=Cohnella silvisoli TaxID=2873699 RepID=A0ABV1KUM7_9BACL|nr:AraC family transcriptional regulator [Cohnella silvisoli]MCD9021421.1 AraC family transcriptional regulator [Cohnella silvisoli]